jgi:membrane protease YdiL (CAAX protease family)
MVQAGSALEQEHGFQSPRVPAAVAIGVGVLLWFSPTLLLPALEQPIVQILRSSGLPAPSAGEAASEFAAALVLRWVAVAALLAFVLGIERLPLRSVGIRKPKWAELLWSAGAGMLSAIVGIGLYLLVQGFQPDVETEAGQLASTLSTLGKIHLIFNAAIVEELFFRGFLIERVSAVTHRVWIGGIISFVLFVASHIHGSGVTESLTIVATGTLVLVLLYLWRRNLFTCIGAHFVGNTPLLLS